MLLRLTYLERSHALCVPLTLSRLCPRSRTTELCALSQRLACPTVFVRIGTENHSKIESGRYSADPPMEHAFLPDDGGFECIFCGRTASEHQKASGGSYESTKPAERDLEMEDEDDWDAIQEELRRLTRRCRQARAAARSSQPTHPRASPAWLSRLRKRRPERRPSCSSQK